MRTNLNEKIQALKNELKKEQELNKKLLESRDYLRKEYRTLNLDYEAMEVHHSEMRESNKKLKEEREILLAENCRLIEKIEL